MGILKKIGPRSTNHDPRKAGRFFLRVGLAVIFLYCPLGVTFAETTDAVVRGPWPKKIVSINLCTDELLFRLVPPERIAAVSMHCADPEVSTVSREAQGVTKIKGGIEEVHAAEPDLIVGGTFSNKATIHFFKYSDTPVLVLGVPKDFDDIYTDIRKLAQATGEVEKGEAMIEQMQKELEALKPKTTPGVGQVQHPVFKGVKRAVFFQSGSYVPGAQTFENAIMEAAGLTNIAAELGIEIYGNLSLEQLIEANAIAVVHK